MRALLGSSSVLVLAMLVAPQAAQSQTSISTATTTPVKTSTANNGAPADISITTAGSIKPTVAGPVVTVDSDNDVTNAGTIQTTGVNNSDGILATVGGTGTITNSGAITLDEAYTPTDTDSDGDIDGPFAQGTNRFGIRTVDGGTFVGSILNSGTIGVEGNDSGGIRVGGTLNGSLTSTGTVAVTGDRSIAIRTGNVTGDVKISGTVGAQGGNAVGVAIDGNVGGKLVFQGAVNATGYRNTTSPADASKLDADDLLQGGGAIRVGGNVAGGILFDIRPADNDAMNADEDGDGIPDASEGSAVVTNYGSAPGLLVGSANAISIGAVDGTANGYGLVVKGAINGVGVYSGVNATGVAIGGQGGTVDLAGGINISGTVGAASLSQATGLALNSGAIVDTLNVSGTVFGATNAAGTARAIVIATGANVPQIINSGTISATSGDDGSAVAILDQSGTLDLVDNTGRIGVGATNATSGTLVAIDLSANAGGAVIRNHAGAAGSAAPSIVGAIKFGGGADLLDIQSGLVVSNVSFGAGADQLKLSGTSLLNGNVDFGGGADTATIGVGSLFSGGLTNASGLNATVAGGFNITTATPVTINGLDVASTGALGVAIDATTGTATRLNVTGTAQFAQGSSVRVAINSVSNAAGSYTIVDAGTLVGGNNLTVATAGLPFLFDSSLAVDNAAGTVQLDIDRKSATALGFNRSEASAYDAVFGVIDADTSIRDVFLGAQNADQVRGYFGNFLPDHAGGVFQTVTLASRTAARALEDRPAEPLRGGTGNALFGSTLIWGTKKDRGNTAGYRVSGWGALGGAETRVGGLGRIGASLGIYLGLDENPGNFNSVETSQYELALHWRMRRGNFSTLVRASYARIGFDSKRSFEVAGTDADFRRQSDASYSGNLFSGLGAISYSFPLSDRLALRPRVELDYFRLNEGNYSEHGGGDGFDLNVDSRDSNELAVEGSLGVGYTIGDISPDALPLKFELEGGQRTILSGTLGDTSAQFGIGNPFTLTPEARTDGWLGRIRMTGGGQSVTFSGEASAEDQSGATNLALRLGVALGW